MDIAFSSLENAAAGNLSETGLHALKPLLQNKDIIQKTNKGNTIVVIDKNA